MVGVKLVEEDRCVKVEAIAAGGSRVGDAVSAPAAVPTSTLSNSSVFKGNGDIKIASLSLSISTSFGLLSASLWSY